MLSYHLWCLVTDTCVRITFLLNWEFIILIATTNFLQFNGCMLKNYIIAQVLHANVLFRQSCKNRVREIRGRPVTQGDVTTLTKTSLVLSLWVRFLPTCIFKNMKIAHASSKNNENTTYRNVLHVTQTQCSVVIEVLTWNFCLWNSLQISTFIKIYNFKQTTTCFPELISFHAYLLASWKVINCKPYAMSVVCRKYFENKLKSAIH